MFCSGEGKPDTEAGGGGGGGGGGGSGKGIIRRCFKVLERKGGTEEEGEGEGERKTEGEGERKRQRQAGGEGGAGFITGLNSLAQPVLWYVLLTPFWQMDANSNSFLSSSFPTAILQFEADL